VKDEWLWVALLVAFAAFCAVHVGLALRLVTRPPRLRGLLALGVLPLAPYWGWQQGFRRSAVAWVVALLVYAMLLGLAQR